jgi:hypothetical protein
MNVFILGVQHGVQTPDGSCSPDKKEKYREMLDEIVRGRGIEYIGEEAKDDSARTFARTFEKNGVCWHQVDMSRQQKAKISAPLEDAHLPYWQEDEHNPKIGITDEGYIYPTATGGYGIIARHPTDSIREDHMFREVVTTACGMDTVLVICGYIHVHELHRRFQYAGHAVSWNALFRYDWFGPI